MTDWTHRHGKSIRAVLLGFALLLMLLLSAAVLTFLTYLQVRGPLERAQSTLTAVLHNPSSLDTAAGRNATAVQLGEAAKSIASAQQEIQSAKGLRLLGVFPGLHTQRVGLDNLVSDLHATASTALELLQSVDVLATDSHGTNISLTDLRALESEMGTARAQFVADMRTSDGLWGPIGTDRKKFDREDVRAIHFLTQGRELTQYALPFLGDDGPRTYLVMGENNAEMRDEGSTLSYSLMHVSNGSLTVTNGGTVNDIELTSPAPNDPIPAGTESAFGELYPSETWQSTNATGNFSFSGRDMQAMFAASVGQHVDGVIGIDVVALQGLLGLTGPISVAGIPEPITSTNASAILLNQLYQGLPPGSSQGPRREELAAVTSATFHSLQSGDTDLVALARVLSTEVAERHLQVWDENAAFERTLNRVGASGNVDTDDPDRTFHVAVENATATKLDYFVSVSISDTVYVTQNGSASIDTAVTLVNHAPAGQQPSYQLGPDGINSHVPGQYVGRVLVWGPRGSTQADSVSESGLELHEEDLSILPGQTAVAEVETTIPYAVKGGKMSLVFVPQPRLAPESLKIHVEVEHGEGLSHPVDEAVLTKTRTFEWHFKSNPG
jgi:uncharacterized protein DUF4012